MDVGSRISQVRGVFSRKTFAERIGVVENTLRSYETGQALPNTKVISAICAEFHVRMPWLVDGTGPMRTGDETVHVVDANRVETLAAESTEILMISMMDSVLSAGQGSLKTGAEILRKYAFRADFLRRKGNPTEMVMMRVDGDSMEPRICSGDVVLIDQSQKTLRPGQIYAVGVEDMIFLKIVSAMPGKVILRSFNDAYPPLEVDLRSDLHDSVRIVGRCVWSCREL
jgi:phage repressor protein C with HTH and peptisase S24 domain